MIWWDIFGVFVLYMKIFAFVSLLWISWLHLTVPLNSKVWHHTINFTGHMRWDEMGQTSEKDLIAWSLWWASKHLNRWSAAVHPTAALHLAWRGFKSQTVYLWLDADVLMYHVTFWDSILMKHCRDRGLSSHNISKHSKVQLCKFLFSL